VRACVCVRVRVCASVSVCLLRIHSRSPVPRFAACCSVLQRVAVRWNVWQRVAACCSVLQRVAACCSVKSLTNLQRLTHLYCKRAFPPRQVQNTTSCDNFGTINSNSIRISTAPGGSVQTKTSSTNNKGLGTNSNLPRNAHWNLHFCCTDADVQGPCTSASWGACTSHI